MTDYTTQLRTLMQPLGFHSFRALAQVAGVSDWQLAQLRKGQVLQLRVASLVKLSQALQKPVDELLTVFSEVELPQCLPAAKSDVAKSDLSEIAQLQQEYQRLQTQLAQQRKALQQEFQQSSLQILESCLRYLPTAVHAAQQNPEFPASRLLPLLRPIDQLLQSWDIEAIAPVGAEVGFDPQWHQLKQGSANPGEVVTIVNTGYRQGEKLLYRAMVSPVVN